MSNLKKVVPIVKGAGEATKVVKLTAKEKDANVQTASMIYGAGAMMLNRTTKQVTDAKKAMAKVLVDRGYTTRMLECVIGMRKGTPPTNGVPYSTGELKFAKALRSGLLNGLGEAERQRVLEVESHGGRKGTNSWQHAVKANPAKNMAEYLLASTWLSKAVTALKPAIAKEETRVERVAAGLSGNVVKSQHEKLKDQCEKVHKMVKESDENFSSEFNNGPRGRLAVEMVAWIATLDTLIANELPDTEV